MEPGEEAAHESQSIFCYSGSYSEQCPSKMCGQRAHNQLVVRSPQFSFTHGQQSSCRHKSVLTICMFLSYKRRVRNIFSVKTLVRRLLGLPALSERNECIKETVLLKLFKVQRSNFKSLRKNWRRPRPPQPPHFRRPCYHLLISLVHIVLQ